MSRWAWLAAIPLLIAGTAAAQEQSRGVVGRIMATGELKAGTRGDARPFAWRGDDGRLKGFAVDLLEEIRARLQTKRGSEVTLKLTEVTPANRVDLVAKSEIDIECGITTATWGRERFIDFSIPFFENGTRILTLRNTFRAIGDLNGKRIGAIRNSTTIEVIRSVLPGAAIESVPDMDEGFRWLDDGKLDGLANIGLVLRSKLETSDQKSRYVLLPRSGAIAWESIACMLPSDDSEWRDFVNLTIATLLDGVRDQRGRWVEMYERWLGPHGELYFPLDREVAERLAVSAYWLR